MSAQQDLEELENLQRDLESGLVEAVPGLEVLDRELQLGEGSCADLAGIDGSGRLVLIMLVEGEGDATALAVLDALAYARENGALLARHWKSARLRTELDAQVVLVADHFSTRLSQRLTSLGGTLVKFLEVHELSSKTGTASYLVPLRTLSSGAAPGVLIPEAYVASLPEYLRDPASLMLRRVGRIDEDLDCTATANGLQWRFQGEVLCSLSQGGERLEGFLAESSTAFNLVGDGQLDAFVERVLECYIERLDGAVRPLGEILEQVEIVPQDRGQLLSPEEIEAFRS